MRESHKIYKILTWGGVGLYTTFMLYISIQTNALVPDERWFWNLTNETVVLNSIHDALLMPNYLGYGSIYWLIMKLLGDFLLIRMIMCILLVSAAICVILTLKNVFHVNDKNIFFSIVLYLSCPLSWFTGKIIGPEIMGYGIGVWGCYAALYAYINLSSQKWVILLTGGILLGISTGIKLNYITFAVFIAIFVISNEFASQEEILRKVMAIGKYAAFTGIGFLLGFLIANPVFLYDFKTFVSFYEADGYSPKMIQNVLFRKYIEWDLVNSGGMASTIISFTAFVAIFLLAFRYKKNRPLIKSGFLSILFLFGLCCKGRFLGWYLLPMIYIISLCSSDINYMPIILAVNLIFMWPNIKYQVVSKLKQMENVDNIEKIQEIIKTYNDKYSEHTQYYMIETCVDAFPMCASYNYKKETTSKRIIYISDRAKANKDINAIYNQSKEEKNGYLLLKEEDSISVILYEKIIEK